MPSEHRTEGSLLLRGAEIVVLVDGFECFQNARPIGVVRIVRQWVRNGQLGEFRLKVGCQDVWQRVEQISLGTAVDQTWQPLREQFVETAARTLGGCITRLIT